MCQFKFWVYLVLRSLLYIVCYIFFSDLEKYPWLNQPCDATGKSVSFGMVPSTITGSVLTPICSNSKTVSFDESLESCGVLNQGNTFLFMFHLYLVFVCVDE